jgi:hypothetical protein
MKSPAETAADFDLASARFRAGVARGQWRQISYAFPMLVVAIVAVEPDGAASEYAFRFELTGFPGIAPEVIIWDPVAGVHLPVNQRPKGSIRVTEAFKDWTAPHPVYRPWERTSGAHSDWAQRFTELLWSAQRDLTFILEDLHGLLTSNAAARSAGSAA